MGERCLRWGWRLQIDGPGIDTRPVSWPEAGIACVWLPQLSLRVEVFRRPELAGRPLVLGGSGSERRLVQLCSPEAEQAGIQPGLPLREVLALCRDAVILQPDPVRVAEIVEETLRGLQRVSPLVEAAEDRFLLDLHGLRAIYGADLAALENAIRAVVPSLLQPHIGIAGGKFTAGVAACLAPLPGIRVIHVSETRAFLAPLSVRHLPLPPTTVRRLELLGLHTIADLAALPCAAVQAEFGPAGAHAWRLANGQDTDVVLLSRFQQAVHTSLSFDDPPTSVETIMIALNHLLTRAFAQPAVNAHSVRQIRLSARLTDGVSWEQPITFKEALLNKDAAYEALKSKLQLPNALPVVPIEELSLELVGLSGEGGKQANLFSVHVRQETQIAEAARQLSARYDRVSLYRAVEVEPWSRIPERRWALVPFAP